MLEKEDEQDLLYQRLEPEQEPEQSQQEPIAFEFFLRQRQPLRHNLLPSSWQLQSFSVADSL